MRENKLILILVSYKLLKSFFACTKRSADNFSFVLHNSLGFEENFLKYLSFLKFFSFHLSIIQFQMFYFK